MVALLDHQALVARQILQRAQRAMLRQIFGRRAQDAVIDHQPPGDQLRRDLVADPYVQIEPFSHRIDQPVEHLEPDLQRRVRARQPGNRRCDDLAAEAETTAHAQLATGRPPPLGRFLDQLIQAGENRLRPFKRLRPVLGDDDAPRRALEQPHAQRGLEHPDPLADVRRRHAQRLRRARKRSLTRHGHEYPQISILQQIIHAACSLTPQEAAL